MSAPGIAVRLNLPRAEFQLSVDMKLPGNGISVLFGPSGSGKTSVLRCVAGLEKAQQARVSIGPRVWQDAEAGVFVPAWRRAVGYVFQEASLFEHLDVRGNLEFGRRRIKEASRESLERAIDLLGIGSLLNRSAQALSGGERQRVAIARALATNPELLLLDEPLAALDRQRRLDILPWLEKMRAELQLPMLYVTHSMEEVLRLADHLVILDRGTVLRSGEPGWVMTQTQGFFDEQSRGPGSVVWGDLGRVDEAWQLQSFQVGSEQWWVPSGPVVRLGRARMWVSARDVALSLTAQHTSSVLNQTECEIVKIDSRIEQAHALVHLRKGPLELRASITRKSVETLQLTGGLRVWAQLKSMALVD
jgi:molybdate transport system ATP-binding protein